MSFGNFLASHIQQTAVHAGKCIDYMKLLSGKDMVANYVFAITERSITIYKSHLLSMLAGSNHY